MKIGQIFTKRNVSNYMLSLFNISKNNMLLDPCFGKGVFIEEAERQGFKNITGFEVDTKLFQNFREKTKDNNKIKLYLDDFLFNKSLVKYDGIIMNPPYIRHEKIDEIPYISNNKKNLKKEFLFNDIPSNSNYYVYFLVKALSVLNENGELIIIFPGSWKNSNNSEFILNYINKESHITDIIKVNGEAFQASAQVDVIIMKIIKSKNTNNIIKYKSINLNYNNLKEINSINEKIRVNFDSNVIFEEYASIRRGITTGYNKMFINPKIEFEKNTCQEHKYIKKILSSPKDIYGYSTYSAKYDKILLLSNIDRICDNTLRYLEYYEKKIKRDKTPKVLYKKIIKQDNSWYTVSINNEAIPNLIFSYFVRDNMKFIYNNNFEIIRDNFYIISNKINLFLLMSLLNNYYTYYQLEVLGKNYGNGLLKLQTYDLKKIIFPSLSTVSSQDIKTLISYGEKLCLNDNAIYLDKITKIISNYSNLEFERIKNLFLDTKNDRLRYTNEKK